MHPTFSSVGENLWVAFPPSHFTVAKAVQKWVDEVNDYNYKDNHCTKICGHYTQVWDLFTACLLCNALCLRGKRKGNCFNISSAFNTHLRTALCCDLAVILVSTDCVGKQLQSWMCSAGVPKRHQSLSWSWKYHLCMQLRHSVSWKHAQITCWILKCIFLSQYIHDWHLVTEVFRLLKFTGYSGLHCGFCVANRGSGSVRCVSLHSLCKCRWFCRYPLS